MYLARELGTGFDVPSTYLLPENESSIALSDADDVRTMFAFVLLYQAQQTIVQNRRLM